MEFQWIPATEPDPQAIERMFKHFPKPGKPMLDPWTIGGLHYHTLAFEESAQTLKLDLLVDLIDDISEGITTIGFYNDYKDRFLYILPHTILRSHEGRLEPILTNLITTFFNIYRDGLTEEYDGFRQDTLNTLAKALMKSEFWYADNDFQIEVWELTAPVYNYEASKTLSATMFLCLKILNPAEITSWTASLLAIPGPKWRINLIKWLINVDKFFEAKFEPGKTIENYLDEYGIRWHAAVFLFRPKASLNEFIPKSNFELFRSALFQKLTPEVFLQWVEEISGDAALKNEFSITGLPDIFFDRFYT